MATKLLEYTFNNTISDCIPQFIGLSSDGYTISDSVSDNITTRIINVNDGVSLPTRIWFSDDSHPEGRSLLTLEYLDTSNINNMSMLFCYCNYLTSVNTIGWDTSKVTDMTLMFFLTSNLQNLTLSNFDITNCTSFHRMFEKSGIVELNFIGNSTNSSVGKNMNKMFADCNKLTKLSISNIPNINNMSWMFSGCSKLESLNLIGLDTSNCTDFTGMFYGCSSLTSLDLSSFNTSKANSMQQMFIGCNKITSLDLSNFNTSKVTDMAYMFQNCSSLTSLDLSSFNTSNVTNMSYMFSDCANLTLLDLSNFDISKITGMAWMFNRCSVPNIGLLYATSSTINGLLAQLGTSTARNIYYIDAPLNELTVQDNITYKKYELTMATLPYTLNKLPNGVADYIDVVNKVHVQRVGVRDYQEIDATDNTVITDTTNTLYELATPIYTPLTNEEIAQLPLSAYADGYINLSSDQLTPSFEFRMRASNRYQVDMLETGYYYLNAPTGNVKLGTANVDVQQMPCIVKVDNVGTGDSGYRLGLSSGGENIVVPQSDMIKGAYFTDGNGALTTNASMCYSPNYYEILPNAMYGTTSGAYTRITLYTENQSYIKTVYNQNGGWFTFNTTSDTKYFRFSYSHAYAKDYTLIANPITLAKLPSHRIPTSFTQGMKCATDFGYWEGIKVATGKQLYVSDTNKIEFNSIELNRIEYNNTIVEDEFDIATGKLIKRIGKIVIDNNSTIRKAVDSGNYPEHWGFMIYGVPNRKQNGWTLSSCSNNITNNKTVNYKLSTSTTVPDGIYIYTKKTRCPSPDSELAKQCYMNDGLTVIYYELAVPEISYISLSANQVGTVANKTLLQSWRNGSTYLNPQCKPSHLTYPVPSLVGNRTYTVVHNRKNITGSTKPITLDLGGTQVELNDTSGKTLVKTPSSLKHSSLIFIGGESTVDHIMVLDGDWTNKPIEYFENMKGHDTDAIITIIGDGKIDDVAEQYLW